MRRSGERTVAHHDDEVRFVGFVPADFGLEREHASIEQHQRPKEAHEETAERSDKLIHSPSRD
jgi:hypothetical protein